MTAPTSRLARRLDTGDAVVIGLGAMIGAGVFAALGPAAAAAGNGLLVGLAIAAVVAYCNATSTARLAAVHPLAGGAYLYGRRQLGPFWGFLAGWGFVVGKTASCAAMAMTFGGYAAPSLARPLGVAAVIALTAVNYAGIQKTAALTRILVVLVLAALGVAVAAMWLGDGADAARLWPLRVPSAGGVLQAAGLLFFAFAGYARIATLGEEVVDPRRVIPRAIPVALGLTLLVYAVVAVSALAAAGAPALARSSAPLATAVESGGLAALAPVVRIGAVIASLGVLLSLIVGISRTVFAMASEGDLPAVLAAVHPRFRVPHRAEIAVGALVVLVVSVADVRSAIGFSSFAVLTYYGVANASAWTLPGTTARHRLVAATGLVGCATLAVALPTGSVLSGAGVLGLGALVHLGRRLRRPAGGPPPPGDPPADQPSGSSAKTSTSTPGA